MWICSSIYLASPNQLLQVHMGDTPLMCLGLRRGLIRFSSRRIGVDSRFVSGFSGCRNPMVKSCANLTTTLSGVWLTYRTRDRACNIAIFVSVSSQEFTPDIFLLYPNFLFFIWTFHTLLQTTVIHPSLF